MNLHGFYMIKDKYFEDMDDPYLKGNKEMNRPHYYCFRDESTSIYWVIPLSSKIEKYRKIIEERKNQNKPCDILHIAKLSNGKYSVFLIQDMFPITDKYIERPYTIKNNPYILKNESLIRIINRKAMVILGLIKNNIQYMPTQPNIPKILQKLIMDN